MYYVIIVSYNCINVKYLAKRRKIMKKKILLALSFVALLVCLFAITVSAANQSYTTFDVTLTDGTTKTVYTPGTDQHQGRVYLTATLFAEAPLDSEGTYETVDWANVKVLDFSNSMIYLYSNETWTEKAYGSNEGGTMMYVMRNGASSTNMANVEKIVTGKATIINGGTFGSLANLKEVVFSNNIKELQYNAFEKCPNLTTVTFEGSNLTTLGGQVFLNCTAIENITLPNTITSFGTNMFQGCTSLKTVNWPTAITTIPNNTFYGCTNLTFEIPSNITSIGNNAFRDCATNITANIPNVISIGSNAFYECKGITAVNAPAVESISDNAFYNCTALTTFTSTTALKTVGQSAFQGCSQLTGTFNFSEMTSIKSNAFNGCVILETGDVNLAKATFLGGGIFRDNTKITSAIIPEGITEVGGSMFRGCSNLKKVTLPSTIAKINGNAFEGCSSLTDVIFTYNYEKYPEFGSALTTVGNGSAFSKCTSLKTLIFPNSLTHIDNAAFSGCTALETLVLGASFATTNQCPAIPKTLTSIIISETYNYNGTLFSGDTNKFSCPATFVVYYTGTLAQAQTLQATNTSCWEISHSTLVSYEEFTSDSFARDESVHYMVYGYNKCEAFYKGEHNKSEVESKFLGQDYVTDFVNASTCTRCALEFVIGEPICGPLFDDLGYSTEDNGTAFAYAIIVNSTNIDKYIEVTGDTLVYGFIVGLYAENSTGDIINANGEAQIANSLVFDFTEPRYDNLNRFELKFTNITNAELGLYCNAYVINDTDVSYIGAVTEDYKASPITFSNLPKKDEE